MIIKKPLRYIKPKHCTCGPNAWIQKNGLDPIPDHLIGLDIKEACCVHDYQYLTGRNEEERKAADELLLSNMLWLINLKTENKILKALRKAKAYLYYYSVRGFGGFNINRKS